MRAGTRADSGCGGCSAAPGVHQKVHCCGNWQSFMLTWVGALRRDLLCRQPEPTKPWGSMPPPAPSGCNSAAVVADSLALVPACCRAMTCMPAHKHSSAATRSVASCPPVPPLVRLPIEMTGQGRLRDRSTPCSSGSAPGGQADRTGWTSAACHSAISGSRSGSQKP